MPIEITHVDDGEELIRSIPAEMECQYDPQTRKLHLPSVAFCDRKMQPSVDRRRMLRTLEFAKKLPTDGLVMLMASEVRGIKLAQFINSKASTTQFHTTDVVHSPIEKDNPDQLPENPAHSHIEITPAMSKAKFDNKIREQLARLASKYGWVVQPTRP